MAMLFCFALKEEAAPFQKITAGKSGVAILLVGIGRQNAETSLRNYLAGQAADLVFTCGFAGGLNPDLRPGAVVFAAGAKRPDIEQSLRSAGARAASFFCADHIAITAAEKRQLRADTGADAVEMESGAIQAVCRERGLPCFTVRVISDAADQDLPLDFNALSRPDKSLDYGRLAWAIARSPGKIGALMTLQKHTRAAARQLATVLEHVRCDRTPPGQGKPAGGRPVT
jgi:nucleoside phosphorylase